MKRSLQRRKDRRALQEKRSLWAFQVLLLILIFFTWLIWAKIYFMFGVVTAHCVEQFVFYDANGSLPSTVTLLIYSTALIILFWAVIAFTFQRSVTHWFSYVLHSVLLICLGLLLINFLLMRSAQNNQPDGTLSVTPLIMDTSFSPPRLVEDTHSPQVTTYWRFIESRRRPIGDFDSSTEECVWLEEGIVTQSRYIEKAGYISVSAEEKEKLLVEREYINQEANPFPFVEASRLAIKSAFGKTSLMERLRRNQVYRNLTDEERARFQRKRACLREKLYTTGETQKCKYVLIEVWDDQVSN